jgi:hypothetical protein
VASLFYAVLFLAAYPEWQDWIREELGIFRQIPWLEGMMRSFRGRSVFLRLW